MAVAHPDQFAETMQCVSGFDEFLTLLRYHGTRVHIGNGVKAAA